MDKHQVCVLLTTVGSEQDAKQLAQRLLAEQLAACVSIGSPVQSHYVWQGELCCEQEWPLTIKTKTSLTPLINQCFAEHHPYQLPECIYLDAQGSDAYLQWVMENCR